MKLVNLIFRTLTIILAITLVFTSCKKDEEEAPQIPPESSFVMDFSAFSNPNDTLASREISTYQNWGYSYTMVLFWQAIVAAELAIPTIAFTESFNHEAVYHPDEDNWTWTYSVVVNETFYTAELTGYLASDSVAWEMRVTSGAVYNGFLWYYGKSALNRSGGWWILQENPLAPSAVLRIDWHNNGDGIADIKYTDVRIGGALPGSYIFYGTTTDYFDRFYNLHNAENSNLTEIQWSYANHDGRVKDAVHFGNENWNCWATNLMDTVCP